MISKDTLEVGDIVEINHSIFTGKREVVRVYEKYAMEYVDLKDVNGKIDDFSISFINSYNAKVTKASKSFTITNETGEPIQVKVECYLHSWKDDIWFTSKVFTYCSTCGKSKEESESKPTREFF